MLPKVLLTFDCSNEDCASDISSVAEDSSEILVRRIRAQRKEYIPIAERRPRHTSSPRHSGLGSQRPWHSTARNTEFSFRFRFLKSLSMLRDLSKYNS